MERIGLARLVRRAVELEVIYEAIKVWDAQCEAKLAANLQAQEDAFAKGDLIGFHALDYDFHKLIYVLGGNPMAFEVMVECKQKVDRLCMLGLEKASAAEAVLADHHEIASGLASHDLATAQAAIRKHLSRLDNTISYIHESHPEYFE